MGPELGISFGNYTLLRRIAQGGMAEVFIARQEGMQGIDRLVAIKRILPHLLDDISFVRMFQNEAKLAARLSHPCIIPIYDFGKVEEHFFIAMEFIEGVHTGQLIQRAAHIPMPPALVARIGVDACAGLHYAHQRTDDNGDPLQLVHRDVSPPNLLVSYDGNLKLLDFGIAKAVNTIEQTRSGIVKGKFAYMSPEQTMGKTLNGRSDVFSLAIVMWELLTGRGAVTRDDQILAMQTIRDGKVPPVETIRKDVPQGLATALKQALQKSPNKRPDAHQFGAALEKFLKRFNEPSSPRDLGTWLRQAIPQPPLFEDSDALVGGKRDQAAGSPQLGAGIAELGDAQRIIFSQPGAEPDYQDFEQRPRDTSGVLPLHRAKTEALVGDDNTVVVAIESSKVGVRERFDLQSSDDNTVVAEMQVPIEESDDNTVVGQMPMPDFGDREPVPREASSEDNSVTRVMEHPLSISERAEPELIASPGHRPSKEPNSPGPNSDLRDTLIAPYNQAASQASPPDNSQTIMGQAAVIRAPAPVQASVILTPAPAPVAQVAAVNYLQGGTAAHDNPGNSRLYLVAFFLLLVLVGIAAFAYDQGLFESDTLADDVSFPADNAKTGAEQSPDGNPPPLTAPVVSPLADPTPTSEQPDKDLGLLTLTCKPNAVVFHGRKKLGVTPLIDLPLKAGTYRLRFKAARRKRTYREVTIRPGESSTLDVRLSRR